MTWQVDYALQNLEKAGLDFIATYHGGEAILIKKVGKPDVVAAISEARVIDRDVVASYLERVPDMDFLCGYRNECVWHGDAIKLLKENKIGWGNYSTLESAALRGNANVASHKTFAFSDRLLRQTTTVVKGLDREYDRVYHVVIKSGRKLRLGMLSEYEPTADVLRTFWDEFGEIDVAWNINPNGNPTKDAIEAGKELGCEVLKWDDLKAYMQKA